MTRIFRGCAFGIVLVLLLVCGVGDGYGAEFGVRIGTQRLESNSESFRPKVGLFYSFQLGKNFNLQPEIYLSYYTYDYAGVSFAGSATSRKELRFYDNIRYLEIPVLLKYRIPLKGDLRPVVTAGGYAGFRLSQQIPEEDTRVFSADWWEGYETPLTREYAGVEGGLVLGIGIEHGSGNTTLSFDVRFNIGLTTLAKIFSSFPTRNEFGIYALSYDYTQRNHSMSFMVGLSF
ncbi:MAG: PorT family protein [Candidatus Aminicenantes bacterium]|nr:MAG: PorT family protein [Candidatus Aminicenantes bacterium]